MSQPVWKFIDNLGDADPITYGGLFLYEDTTGVYPPELEKLEEPEGDEDDEGARWTVHRVSLDKLKLHRDGDRIYLVPDGYEESWPHPASAYTPWFAHDLDSIASTMSTTTEELEKAFCSDDSEQRAWAYQCVYDYHGWDNGDGDPRRLTREEVEARYADEL